ncbi:protein FAR1-RELATED SEQUENCE 5-like [Amaranthus tricolor]|uniref:protein FAR1-RELATED SEQUENCE 5-like n=1 Tax=Amaranthus tricolor TaxID=29722 RepID=UPI00258DC1F7|nr:protein FAR1-RELATED SEQUENCE 5-like [Amaranthus tricolor]
MKALHVYQESITLHDSRISWLITKTPRTVTHVSPNGSTEWFPYCEDDKKPFVSLIFENLEKASDIYTREGFMVSRVKKNKGDVVRYKRSTKTVGCKANLILKIDKKKGMHFVFKFVEGHRLVKSFRLFKENVGSYENVGATMQDFKNFHRDFKNYIKGDDEKILIENFIKKRDIFLGFYFDYALDEDNHTSLLFWAGTISRKNYALFGEMVTFDCTYDNNKCSMVLAPFTGVDQYRSCITFGVGLLAKEDTESFEWLFMTFSYCMGDCMPTYLINDQDSSMKIPIKNVFPNTIRKLCMWHIMSKVADKVGPELNKDEFFLKELNSCVWNVEQEESEFEEKWEAIMIKYNLLEDKWFCNLFSIRDQWIPAYFKDITLEVISRTTSRSESINNFFNNFSNPHMTLVEFYMSYESAMDAQRYNQ